MANPRIFDPPLTLIQIATHHETLESSVHLYFSSKNPNYSALFPFDTLGEITSKRDETLYETRASSAFNVLAWIEASFRIDYLQRIYTRKKDDLSKAYYALYRQKRERVAFSDDILQLWKELGGIPAHVVGEIRGAFHYRDWIAHGRYWQVNLDRTYDFETVYDLACLIETQFVFLQSAQPRR